MFQRFLVGGGLAFRSVRGFTNYTFIKLSAMSGADAGKKTAAYRAVDEWLKVFLITCIKQILRMIRLLVSAAALRLSMLLRE